MKSEIMEVLPSSSVQQGTGSPTNNASSTPKWSESNSTHRLGRRKKMKVKQLVKQRDDGDGLGEKRGAMMVVSVLIATLTYQAALNPPGGIWQDNAPAPVGVSDEDQHEAGTAINGSTLGFKLFLMSNMVALFASLIIILLLTSAITIRRRFMMWVLMIIMWVSVFSVAFSFLLGIRLILSSSSDQEINYLVYFTFGCMVLISLLVLLHIFVGLRGIYRWLKKKLRSDRQNVDSVSSSLPLSQSIHSSRDEKDTSILLHAL